MAAVKKVSATQLSPADKDGFLTKQGGSIKTWKKRWFILKDDTLYYFKNPKDVEQTGEIKLDASTKCTNEGKKKGKVFFAVTTISRKYMIYADTEESANQWVEKINKLIDGLKGGNAPVINDPVEKPKQPEPETEEKKVEEKVEEEVTTTTSNDTEEKREEPAAPEEEEKKSGISLQKTDTPAKAATRESKVIAAKNAIPFLQDEDSKVLEFWEIWSESVPTKESLSDGNTVDYQVSTSSDRSKLTWRTSGLQNLLIQKMVDFFWNVGAPETEIDRLNDIGALINPSKIGSWIDMSAKGGMDGGWFFPVQMPISIAIEAADVGEPTKAISTWTEKHSIANAQSVGRDMGAAPPRQTEIRVTLPGDDFSSQLDVALDAFSSFGFPDFPESALNVLRGQNTPGLNLSIITSSEGFVRLGLLCPNPSAETVNDLCEANGSNAEDIKQFQDAIHSDGPAFVEYQFLKNGFGYGVYKEGFDIVFHYGIGA